MGGIGSGTWYRWNTKTTIEDCKAIDIRWMERKTWLFPGKSGSLSWTYNGEPWGNIRFTTHDDKLILSFRYLINGDVWQPVKQSIYFSRSYCNYGGQRKWFLCPECGRRCAIPYGASSLFLCRKCYKLPYASQMKGKLDRLIEQKDKLGNRIFEEYDGYGWRKKKGMHQKTFDQLLKKYNYLDIAIDNGISSRLITYV